MLLESPRDGGVLLIFCILTSFISSQFCKGVEVRIWMVAWGLATIVISSHPMHIGIEYSTGVLLVLCPVLYCTLEGKNTIAELYSQKESVGKTTSSWPPSDNIIFPVILGCLQWILLLSSALMNIESGEGDTTFLTVVLCAVVSAIDKYSGILTDQTTKAKTFIEDNIGHTT